MHHNQCLGHFSCYPILQRPLDITVLKHSFLTDNILYKMLTLGCPLSHYKIGKLSFITFQIPCINPSESFQWLSSFTLLSTIHALQINQKRTENSIGLCARNSEIKKKIHIYMCIYTHLLSKILQTRQFIFLLQEKTEAQKKITSQRPIKAAVYTNGAPHLPLSDRISWSPGWP